MKKILILTLALFSLATSKVYTQTCHMDDCASKGDPYIGDCFAGIERYLARSMSMDGLTRANDANNSWPVACQSSSYACNEPYSSCPLGGYCPQRYCEDIKVLTDLKIAFVRRAAHIWGTEKRMQIGNSYYKAARQTVIDINKAYDCAGLRRPIIQAAILEYITEEVNRITIPQYVKAAFSMDSDFDPQLYSDNSISFSSCRIAIADCIGTPDLNKIETRMWFYYLATQYIDFGYKALHMGNIDIMRGSDFGNAKTYSLFQKFRNYAKNKNSFVIIDAHTNEDLYLNDSNTLLLDFNSAPIRPIETHSNSLGSSCADEFKTQIIAAKGDIYNKSKGGISPMGCIYQQTPYFVELDHHSADCGAVGQIHSGSWCVWGYDEVNYFYNLSDECKLDFIDYTYLKVRDIDYRGFLQIPGRHGTGSWSVPNGRSFYRLNDYSNLKSGINTLLEPSTNTDIAYHSSNEYVQTGPNLTIYKKYNFTATDTDDSSVLSWHIKKPDGSWEPFTYGEDRLFRPVLGGEYTIYLRQDNLGLPPSTMGTRTMSIKITVPSEPYQFIPDFYSDNFGKALVDLSFQDEDILNQNEKPLKEAPVAYPNPTSDVLYIDMKDYSNDFTVVTIIDMLGRSVLEQNIKKNISLYSIELAGINSGIYNLILRQNEQILNYKIVIEK